VTPQKIILKSFEVLTAYVREHAAWPPKSPAATGADQGSDTLAALTEAIRALERIATGAEPETVSLPQRRPAPLLGTKAKDELPALPTDVQAVMSVLGRRTTLQDRPEARLSLSRTDLRRVVLEAEGRTSKRSQKSR
jgi:hypothetical protein